MAPRRNSVDRITTFPVQESEHAAYYDAETVERPVQRRSLFERLMRYMLAVPFLLARQLGWRKIGVTFLIAVGWIGAWYFYTEYRSLADDPNIAAQREATRVLTELGALIELPQGELPSIAIITDASKLASEPFFAKAQQGDTLLVYQQAHIAYLYRESQKKIINVGALVLPPSSNQAFKVPVSATVEEDNSIADDNDKDTSTAE